VGNTDSRGWSTRLVAGAGRLIRVQMMTSTIERFNAIRWHDSKLIGLSFLRAGSEEQVRISLLLRREGEALEPAEMVFRESTYVEVDVDLDGKRVCADDIADAQCLASSDWMRKLSERNPHDSFDGYLHFEIELIPPGGTINILAKDFALELKSSG